MRLRTILVVLFFALMFLHFAVHCYHEMSMTLMSSSRGWTLSPIDGTLRLIPDRSEADTSTLKDGDEVVAINGQRTTNGVELNIAVDKTFARLPAGSTYSLTVLRDGQTRELTLTTARRPLWLKLADGFSWLLLAVFPLTGLIVFWLKPDSKQALLLAVMLNTCWQWAYSPQSLMTVIFFDHSALLTATLMLALIVLGFFSNLPPFLSRFPPSIAATAALSPF
jgi:hypothetical protein